MNGRCRERLAAERALRTQKDVMEAFRSPVLGPVSFVWGERGQYDPQRKTIRGGHGLAKTIQLAELEGIDGAELVRRIPRIVLRGELSAFYGTEDGTRVNATLGNETVVLSLRPFGQRKTWVLEAWGKTKGPASATTAPAATVSATPDGDGKAGVAKELPEVRRLHDLAQQLDYRIVNKVTPPNPDARGRGPDAPVMVNGKPVTAADVRGTFPEPTTIKHDIDRALGIGVQQQIDFGGPKKTDGPNIVGYHTYAVKANINGEPSYVALTLREQTDGTLYYDNHVTTAATIEKGSPDQPQSDANRWEDPASLSKNRLYQWWHSVKPWHEIIRVENGNISIYKVEPIARQTPEGRLEWFYPDPLRWERIHTAPFSETEYARLLEIVAKENEKQDRIHALDHKPPLPRDVAQKLLDDYVAELRELLKNAPAVLAIKDELKERFGFVGHSEWEWEGEDKSWEAKLRQQGAKIESSEVLGGRTVVTDLNNDVVREIVYINPKGQRRYSYYIVRRPDVDLFLNDVIVTTEPLTVNDYMEVRDLLQREFEARKESRPWAEAQLRQKYGDGYKEYLERSLSTNRPGTVRERGGEYEAGRARELERARKEDAAFGGLVEQALGALDEKTQIPIGETGAVLRAMGARALPLTIAAGTIRKDTRAGGHGVPVELLKRLPSALADPLMVFDSATQPDAFVVVTALEYDRKPLVAAVHLNEQAGRYEVNRVASVYGKDHPAVVAQWMQNGLLRYWDKERSLPWFQTRGLQLPAVGTTSGSSAKILSPKDVFKTDSAGAATEPPGDPLAFDRKGSAYDSIEKIVEKTQRKPAKAEGQETDHLSRGKGASVFGDWWQSGKVGLTRITPDGKAEKIPGAVFSAVDTQKIVQWQGTVAGMPLDTPEQRAAAWAMAALYGCGYNRVAFDARRR